MNFRVLPLQLHSTAEDVARFFKDDRGISKFAAEEQADKNIEYRPTLRAISKDCHDTWIEVSETPYLQSLDGPVLHCVANSKPVKLYVAFPSGAPTSEYKKRIDEARSKGVGAIEVTANGCTVIHEARLLSLEGVRCEDRKKFPPRYRAALSSAETTFKNGDPAKGCAIVYDEIEALSRRLAKKVQTEKWYSKKATAIPAMKTEKENWAPMMEALLRESDQNKFPKDLNKSLLMRVAALTAVRNDSGHKPKDRAAQAKRDRELRTRFESAVDVLRDFADAAKTLRI